MNRDIPHPSWTKRSKSIPLPFAVNGRTSHGDVREKPRYLKLAAVLLFLSGAAGLIYQLLWIKQLSLIVGVEVHAITTAVAAFFAGLAAGNWVFGRLADRSASPWRLYALIETGIAILAVGSTIALAHAALPFVRLEASVGALAWLLPFALVGIPATLMGGTVPVLLRACASQEGFAAIGGVLYAANTVGAIAGSLLTVFAFIPAFGVRGSAFGAATVNVLAAACAALLPLIPTFSPGKKGQDAPSPVPGSSPGKEQALKRDSREKQEKKVPSPRGEGGAAGEGSAARRTPSQRLALILYSIAGGIALGYEVIWSQTVVQWTSTRSFAFAIVLATYLTGLAIGSALSARRIARIADPWNVFGLLIAAAGLVAVLAVALVGEWLHPLQVSAATALFGLTHIEAVAMAGRFATASAWFVLAPTLLLGAAFPVVLRLYESKAHPGRDSGIILAMNTVGGIIGTLLAGFVLVPRLGLERSLALMAVGACVTGSVAAMRGSTASRLRWATFTCAALSLGIAIAISPDHLARLLADSRGGDLVFHESAAGSTVAVIEQGQRDRRFRRLYVDGVSNSGDSMTSLRYMRLQALLPLLIHRGEPRSALVVGLGTGITTGALLPYPALERRVCAELLPAIVDATPLFTGNYQVANDPRVEIRLRDGRRELLRSDERYDLITLEPPPPSAAGVVNLYSRNFYELAGTRLNENGLFAQWLPLPTQTDADTRSLVRSFIDAFPYATLWTTELHEMLLLGSPAPIELDAKRVAARFEAPAVAAALREVGIGSPQALLATWITDRSGLEAYTAGARPVTDDDPRIEYGEWVMPDEFPRMLPGLLALRTEVPVRHADEKFIAAMREERQRLLLFYGAALNAYRGDREGWHREMQRVTTQDPANDYYRWIAGH